MFGRFKSHLGRMGGRGKTHGGVRVKQTPLKRRTALGRGQGLRQGKGFAHTPGYDYAAFCEAIADRDGADCMVRRLLGGSCDGQLDGHHLLPKQWLKRDWPNGAFACYPVGDGWLEPEEGPEAWADWTWPLEAILNDPRNGLLVCRKHHDELENGRVALPRDLLPSHVEEFALELGDRAVARLERTYGERTGG